MRIDEKREQEQQAVSHEAGWSSRLRIEGKGIGDGG